MIKRVILGLTTLLILYGGWAFYSWQVNGFNKAHPDALNALTSDDRVKVTDADWLIFEPIEQTPRAGFILYPGGLCDHRGYAAILKEIAAAGFLVVTVPVPLNLAILASNDAELVINSYPEIENWVIGGHSLGGLAAAQFVSNHTEGVDGLLLWDSFLYEGLDLSDTLLSVAQIHRSTNQDPMPKAFLESRQFLPEHTAFYPIPGGTHMNFGQFVIGKDFTIPDDWGPPPSESISVYQQHRMITAASLEFLYSTIND